MKWAASAVCGLAVLSAAAGPTAAEPACDPVAIVEGDPALVSSLSAQLIRRGIAIDEAADSEDPCPAVRATGAQDGGAVSVTVEQPDGEKVERDVTTTEIAAIWIESRMRRDVGAPLLAVRVPLVVNPGPAPGATPVVDAGVAGTAFAVRGRDRVSLSARIENGSADDGSGWRTYSAAVCGRIGPLCVGLLGRIGENPEAFSEEPEFTAVTRDSKDLMLTASWPLRAGRLTILPEVGVGIGSMTTRQLGEVVDGYFPPDECWTDPPIPPELCEIPAPLNVTTWGGRLSAGLTLVIPLHDRIALDIGVSAEWLQGAHTDPHLREAPPECDPDGNPFPCVDMGDIYDEFIEYSGEPSRLFRAGIGVRVGLP